MKWSFFYVIAAMNLVVGLWNLRDREWIDGFFSLATATVFFLAPRMEKAPKPIWITALVATLTMGVLLVVKILRDHIAR